MTEGLKKTSHQSVYIGYSTPSPYGHSPYLIYDEQRERIENGISRFGTKIALYPSPLSHNTTGHGWGEGIKKTQRYLHRPVIILQKTAGDEVPVFGYKCGVSVSEASIGKQSVFAQIDE